MSEANPHPLRTLMGRWLKPQLPLLLGGITANLCVAAATAALPILIQQVSDELFASPDASLLWLLPLAAAVLMAARALASFIAAMCMGMAARRMGASIQKNLLARLVLADYGNVAKFHSGRLSASFLNDVGQLESSLPQAAVNMTRDSFTILGLFAAMFWLDWFLASFCIIAAPPAWLILRRFGRRTRSAAGAQMSATASFSTQLGEILRGLRIIKAYGTEKRELARADTSINAMLHHYFRNLRGQAAAGPVMELIAAIAIAAILYYAAAAASAGTLTQGEFTGFLSALLLSYQPLRALARFHAVIQQASAAAERLLGLFADMPDETSAENSLPDLVVQKGEIRIENISFAYPESEPAALNQFDLKVAAGESLALVGPSGGGKSTLLNLLLCLYAPQKGEIFIDGQALSKCNPASVRRQIAIVTQEPLLFDDSIAANIAYARPEASRKEIEEAAKQAQAHDFIMDMPQTYDSTIGEGGRLLSGGQRQRLALARAILRSAPIVLMDEPTSALDGESERKVQAAMETLMQGRTNIIIAHRLSTITGAARICVLDKGQLAESGNHQSLLKQNGLYARLFASPQKKAKQK